MSSDFYQIFDECVDRINSGASIRDCLESFPEFSDELKPLLEEVVLLGNQNLFMPSDAAKNRGKHSLYQTIEEVDKESKWWAILPRWISGNPKLSVPALSAVVVVIVAVLVTVLCAATPDSIQYPPEQISEVKPVAVETGILELRVATSPAIMSGNSDCSLTVALDKLEACRAGIADDVEWAIITDESRVCEILTGDRIEESLGEFEVETGHYNQIRSTLGITSFELESGIEKILTVLDGTSEKAALPDGQFTLFERFDIEKGIVTVITIIIDFENVIIVDGIVDEISPIVNFSVSYEPFDNIDDSAEDVIQNTDIIDESTIPVDIDEEIEKDEPVADDISFDQGSSTNPDDETVSVEVIDQSVSYSIGDDSVDEMSDSGGNGDETTDGEVDNNSDIGCTVIDTTQENIEKIEAYAMRKAQAIGDITEDSVIVIAEGITETVDAISAGATEIVEVIVENTEDIVNATVSVVTEVTMNAGEYIGNGPVTSAIAETSGVNVNNAVEIVVEAVEEIGVGAIETAATIGDLLVETNNVVTETVTETVAIVAEATVIVVENTVDLVAETVTETVAVVAEVVNSTAELIENAQNTLLEIANAGSNGENVNNSGILGWFNRS